MQEEIETALVEISLEAKQKRRRIERNILIVVFLSLLFFMIPYYYPAFIFLYGIDTLVIALGSLYIFLSAIPNLIQPLKPEYYAFKKIIEAVKVLEKSKKPLAYKEAHHNLQKAYNVLNDLDLQENVSWYKPTNEILKNFLKNVEGIVLPVINDSIIKEEHLREMALAIYSLDIAKIDAVNKTLEGEETYKKSTAKVETGEGIGLRTRRYLAGHNIIKHGLIVSSVLVICVVLYYVGVNYLGIQKEYAYTTSAGAGVTLLVGIYFPRRPPKESP